MKHTLLSVAAASALMAISTGAFAADIVRTDSFSGHLYHNKDINDLKGGTFRAEGSWENIILADDNDYTISDFTSFIINNKNTITDKSVNGLQAANGRTLKLLNMGTISIYESGESVTGWHNDPLPIHALGGHIVIDATGDIHLESSVSNGLMVQATTKEGKEASAVIKTAGNFTVKSEAAAVLAALIQPKIQSSRVEVQAKNISLQSLTDDGVSIYDADKTWNPDDPKAGSASVNLNAEEDLSISAKRFGIYQKRLTKDVRASSSSTFRAGRSINISAQSSAVRVVSTDRLTNEVVFNSPEVTLTSSGVPIEIKDKKPIYYATLDAGQNGNIAFMSDTGATRVTITAEKGDAVNIKNTGSIALTKATVNVVKGNVVSETEGTLSLTDSTMTLAKGCTADLDKLEGSNSAIVLNDLSENTVKVASNNVKNLRVIASSAVTASEGAEAVAQKIRTAANVAGAEADTAVFGGEGTGLTSDYLIDKNGAVSYANGEAESAILSSAKHFNAANLSQWRYEINHLSDRLGDVRNQKGAVGSWARVYGANAKVDDSVSTEMRWNSIQVGADVKVGDNWIVGGAFGYTDGRGDFTNGDASSDGYTFSAYGTAFFPCGGYVDLIGRVGRISSDITLEGASTSYDNTTFGLSAEVGYKWDISQTFFVTPQAELSYGYVKGDDYTLGHALGDVRVEQDNYTTLVGRLGFQAGASFPNDAGQIYVTASVNHDFLGDTDSTAFQGVEKRHISEDLGGTWFSYGVGAQIKTSDSMYFYGSLTRANGSDYQENFRYSAGMRIVF